MADDLVIKTIFKAIDRITGPVKRMSSSLSRFSRKAAQGLGRVNRVTSKLGTAISRGVVRGLKAAAVGAAALGAALWKIISVGSDFERKMVSATAKFPEGIKRGTKEFENLENAVRKVGGTTEFKASQAAEALDFLAMAGFNATQATAALPGVVDLATASNTDLATATDIASDSLNAFGLASKDSAKLTENLARVNDVLLKTTTSANTNMEMLFESVKSGAPTVTAAGQSIETFASLVGTMADAGIKGESAGTAVRNMFLRLQAPVGAAKGLIKDYIGNIENADGSMIDIVEVMRRLEGSFKNLGKIEQAKILDTIFGKKAIGAAQVVLAKGADGLEVFRNKLLDAKGAAAGLAGEMRNTTAGSIDNLKSAVESVIISLFKLDDSGIKGVIDSMTEWIRTNEKMIVQKVGDTIEWIRENFDKLVKTIKVIATVIGTVWALSFAIKGVSAALTLVNLVMAANPVVLIVMGIIAAVALMAALVVIYWDDIVSAWQWTVDKFELGIAATVEFFSGLIQFFVDFWTVGAALFLDGVNAIVGPGAPLEFLMTAFNVLKEALPGIFEFIASGVKMWVGVVADTLEWLWNKITGFYSKVGDVIGSIMGFFGGVADTVGTAAIGARMSIDDNRENLGFGAPSPSVQSPAARAAAIDRKETKELREGKLTILNESGRNTSYAGDPLLDLGISMQPTGSF